MAQVPYQPIPTTGPSGQALPGYRVTPPSGAFGENIAQAIGHLGQVSEKVGDEIFARAVQMQNLNNEAEARQADTDYMIGAGNLHATYSSLEGKQAVDAYAKYQTDLKELRESIRGDLNPMAAKLYDGNSLSTMGKTIFNGAGHAATENKKYATQTSAANVQALQDQALQFPKDDVGFQSGIQKVTSEVHDQGNLHGWSEEQTNQEVAKQTSNMWSMRIAGLVKTDPIAAKKMFDEATKKGQIRGEQIGKVNNMVEAGLVQQGSRMLATQVRSGSDLFWGSKPVDIGSARDAIGEFETGNNYQARGKEVFDKRGVSRGRALGRYQVMPENLQPWLKEAGLPAMSEEQFLKSPSAQDQVFATVFGRYMKDTGSFNDAASMWFSGQPMAKAGDVTDANDTSVPQYLRATNAILARNAPLAAKINRGKELAQTTDPDNPQLEDYTVNRIESNHSRDRRVKMDDDFTNRQTIEGALIEGGPDGKLPGSLDELFANPEAEAAWNRLEPSQKRKYLGVLAHNAKEPDVTWNDARLRQYQGLKGMAQSDPGEFLNADVITQDLPNSAKKELINLQGRLKANAESDPRVTKAMTILQGPLFAAGITKQQDKESYYQFTGALQDAIELFQQDNKRAPRAKEIQEIGAQLLQEKAGSGWFGTNVGAERIFNLPVPDAEAQKIKADPYWTKKGIIPDDAMIKRIYAAQTYQQLYGKKAAPEAEAKAGPSPQVPASR